MIGPVPMATITGLVHGVGLTVLALSLILSPVIGATVTGGPISWVSVGFVLAIYAACFIIYYGAKTIPSTDGRDRRGLGV